MSPFSKGDARRAEGFHVKSSRSVICRGFFAVAKNDNF
jgi:hypothetical protein